MSPTGCKGFLFGFLALVARLSAVPGIFTESIRIQIPAAASAVKESYSTCKKTLHSLLRFEDANLLEMSCLCALAR